jgi:hypothetical protein
MRLCSFVFCCALIPTIVLSEEPKPAPAQWVTIKGRVVFPETKPIPKRLPLDVGANNGACLVNGAILDETAIVNPKNRGIKNVVVFLRPLDPQTKEFAKGEIHPDDAKRKPAELTITQPCCMFVDRVLAARVGDTIVVNNPAAMVHNFFWASAENEQYNPNIPAKGLWKMPKPLVAESTPIPYKCTVHPWMTGYVRIFNHPYYAVTDEDGNFQIKNAPTGKFRIVYWHETGLRGGKNGRLGEPIAIAGPTMEMKPVDFDVTPK